MKILYVDDNAVDRVVAQRLAKVQGFALDVAESALQGIALFEERAYDGLVVDLIMPVNSGLDVVRHVRLSPMRSDTPVIILTAAAVPELEEECLLAGANQIFMKPVLFGDVLQAFHAIRDKTEPHVGVA